MIDSDNQDGSLLASFLRIDALTGYLLTFAGLVVLVVVLYQVHSIFTDPLQLSAFQEVFASDATISWQDGFITLPPEILAYFFPLSLLSLASGIGRFLISSGIGLIRKKAA